MPEPFDYSPSWSRVRLLIESLAEDVRAERERRARGPGGQQVSPHGEWINAPLPLLGRLEWWTNELQRSMPAEDDDG